MDFTTIEKLALELSACYDAIVRYKGFVCVARKNWKGTYEAEVYEFIEEDFSEIENRISLLEGAYGYTNSGDAMKWCFDCIDNR